MKNAILTFLLTGCSMMIHSQIVTTITGSLSGYKDGAFSEARFSGLNSIALDKQGNLYVGDGMNKKIRRIDLKNKMVTTVHYKGEKENDTLIKFRSKEIPFRKSKNLLKNNYLVNKKGSPRCLFSFP